MATILALLDGREPLDTLTSLRSAIKSPGPDLRPDPTMAIGLDSCVLLNLGKGRSSADVIDYLGQQHTGPLILPAQAINEFWNNQVGGIHGLSATLRQRFDDLSKSVAELDPYYTSFRDGAKALMDEFSTKYGHVIEGRLATQLTSLLDVLDSRAVVPSVPRFPLSEVADRRRAAKIPPGFKDDGHGDFYVWCEFLAGLRAERRAGAGFNRVVLVTDDRKPDWSTKGTTHPVLSAEVGRLVGAAFETWSLQNLEQFVVASLDGKTEEQQSEG